MFHLDTGGKPREGHAALPFRDFLEEGTGSRSAVAFAVLQFEVQVQDGVMELHDGEKKKNFGQQKKDTC